MREDWAEKSAAGELILQKIRIETAKCNNILNTYIYLNTIFKIDIAFSNKTSENQGLTEVNIGFIIVSYPY